MGKMLTSKSFTKPFDSWFEAAARALCIFRRLDWNDFLKIHKIGFKIKYRFPSSMILASEARKDAQNTCNMNYNIQMSDIGTLSLMFVSTDSLTR